MNKILMIVASVLLFISCSKDDAVKVEAQSIQISKTSLELMVGSKETLTATVNPKNVTNKTFKWISSDEKILSVNAKGEVTALAVGKADVTVSTANGVTSTCRINVVSENAYKSKELQKTLANSEFGWQFKSEIDNGIGEYRLLELKFSDSAVVTVRSESTKLNEGTYKIKLDEDKIVIELSTNAGFVEPRIILDPKEVAGPVVPMDLVVKTIEKDKITLTFTQSGLTRSIELTKLTKEIDFSKQNAIRAKMGTIRSKMLKDFILKNPNCKPYLTLCITKGIGDASVEKPVKAGFFYSSMTATADIAYSYKKTYAKQCGMLVFTEKGFVSGISMQFGSKFISKFKYNETKDRFEVDEDGIEGHFEIFTLPQYEVKGVVDEFMNDYSLWMRNFFPEELLNIKKRVSNSSFVDETKLKVIDTYIVTKYNRREPIIGDDGEWAVDEQTKKYDYQETELLGDGMLFCFESYYQFFYYFVPFKVIKIGEDRVRFERNGETQCNTRNKAHAPIMKNAYDNNKVMNDFIDQICNKEGFLLVKSKEKNSFDFDFRFINHPDRWFIARNQ